MTNPEMHILKFEVEDVLHGDMKLEVQITIGHYATSATLCLIKDGKYVALDQTRDETWTNMP